jgi:hypothetical protein
MIYKMLVGTEQHDGERTPSYELFKVTKFKFVYIWK